MDSDSDSEMLWRYGLDKFITQKSCCDLGHCRFPRLTSLGLDRHVWI